MSESISFERAADFYDATRALPDNVAAKLTEALLTELSRLGADRVLEVGVGTGRISRPLMERGIRVQGIDISPAMMRTLRRQLGAGHIVPDLMLGDATRLPVLSGSVPAVLMVHILHLVSSMPEAVAEVARVVPPGGVLLHDMTRYSTGHVHEGPWQASADIWAAALAPHDYERRRRPEPEEVHAALKAQGATLRVEQYATYEETSTPQEHLDSVRNRIYSWSWEFPDDLFAEVFAEYEPKYRTHYGDMDRGLTDAHDHELEIWTFP
ncbi:MAG: methyltransferase domain-containing protein [Chloroflexi bacterium]|nr:methyltransferase domain-containing protein [Chloroflexota bacterium]